MAASSPAAIATRRLNRWREILFLLVPPVIYLLVAMSAKTNIGVRHILPLYVFLAMLVGGAAWGFIRRNPRWAYAVLALLLFVERHPVLGRFFTAAEDTTPRSCRGIPSPPKIGRSILGP